LWAGNHTLMPPYISHLKSLFHPYTFYTPKFLYISIYETMIVIPYVILQLLYWYKVMYEHTSKACQFYFRFLEFLYIITRKYSRCSKFAYAYMRLCSQLFVYSLLFGHENFIYKRSHMHMTSTLKEECTIFQKL
jgi:hypothetical protein